MNERRMNDGERKEEVCRICDDIQNLSGDLWSSTQRYTNKAPSVGVIRALKTMRAQMKRMIVKQEENNYELIENE